MKKIIKLPKENLKLLDFFVEGLYFHVVVAAYDEYEKNKIAYLKELCKSEAFNTEDICKWCINQKIRYQILYPIKKWSMIKNPIKYLRYIKLKHNLELYGVRHCKNCIK